MKLLEAKEKLEKIEDIPFGDIFKDREDFIKNKGKVGQVLELALGLKNTNKNIDFEDGELKTNKCDEYGNPLETICVTQISSMIDELYEKKKFKDTRLYEKISNVLYVLVCKEGNPEEWKFIETINININSYKYKELREILESDYSFICDKIHEDIDSIGRIKTTSGKYLQIRTKDSKDKNTKEYHHIYSKIKNKYVSNKNYAFYLKKNFIKDIRSID